MVSFNYTPQRKYDAEELTPFSGDLLAKALESYGNMTKTKYLQPTLEEALQKAKLYNQYYGPNIESEIGLRGAQAGAASAHAGLLGSQTTAQDIENKFGSEMQRAKIAQALAQAQYYKQGGYGGGVGQKDQLAFLRSVQEDNPKLSENQIREAANAIAKGEMTLPDGTPIVASPLTKMTLDRAIKSTTTSQQINQQLNANKAEKEIDVLQNYATKGLEPYGNTFNGYSPTQIVDTFKTDDKSQEQLGKFIASQALQYEIAQNRIRLANGQPGVTSTQELMDLSGQSIKTNYPKLSFKARQEASRYLDEALKSGNKARQQVGLGASSITSHRAQRTPESSGMSKKEQALAELKRRGVMG